VSAWVVNLVQRRAGCVGRFSKRRETLREVIAGAAGNHARIQRGGAHERKENGMDETRLGSEGEAGGEGDGNADKGEDIAANEAVDFAHGELFFVRHHPASRLKVDTYDSTKKGSGISGTLFELPA